MRDEEAGIGVFRDPEEYQQYRAMFANLTQIMAQIGFCDEVTISIFISTRDCISCSLK